MFDPQASVKAEHKKRIAEQKKGVLRFFLLLAGGVILCVVTIGISFFFHIRSIEVFGNVRYPADELIGEAGVTVGAPLTSADPEKICEELKQTYPWIRDVTVTRDLLGHIRITVTEYSVAYTVSAANGLFHVSEDLFVLEETDREHAGDYLTLFLPEDRNAEPGSLCTEWKEESAVLLRITEALHARPELTGVTELNLSERYYYSLNTSDGVVIVLGNTDSIDTKLELAVAILSENMHRTWKHAEVNVSNIKKSTFRIID